MNYYRDCAYVLLVGAAGVALMFLVAGIYP